MAQRNAMAMGVNPQSQMNNAITATEQGQNNG